MATAPSQSPPSPPKSVENNHQEPRVSLRPPSSSLPSPESPIEDAEHQQRPPNSNSPSMSSPLKTSSPPVPPENLVDHQQTPPAPPPPPPHENVDGHRLPPISPGPPPPEGANDRRQTLPPTPPHSSLPPSPPPTVAEDPPENLPPSPAQTGNKADDILSEHESKHRQSLLSPIKREGQFVNPNYIPNSESSLQKHQSPPTPPPGLKHPAENLNYRNYPNPNSNRKHDSSCSPPPGFSIPYRSATPLQHHLQENPSLIAHQSPQDPSLSPPPPPPPTTVPSPSSPQEILEPNTQQTPPPPTVPSPSSPQETLEPNTQQTPPPPPLGVPLLKNNSTFSPYRPQPSPWTHQETVNLIQAYQEKWYSLRKGQLKAGQWEEIAITVAARCGYDEPTKSAKQCRHKIEKLRKRYRAERGKPRSKANAWYFFELMDNLEKGPLPLASSRPVALLLEYPQPSNSSGKRRKNDDSDSDSEFLLNKKSRRSKRSNRVSGGNVTRNLQFPVGGSDRVMRGLRTPVVQKQKGFYQEDAGEEEEDNYEEDNEVQEEEGVAAQLAAEIKGFAERFVKMETKKIEMIRDAERYRLEMENKRMEMILESQQNLVELVNKAFSNFHKTQKLSAN